MAGDLLLLQLLLASSCGTQLPAAALTDALCKLGKTWASTAPTVEQWRAAAHLLEVG